MTTLPFECEDCGARFRPDRHPESCQCDHGRCECGGVLEQIDPRESVRMMMFWMLCGVLVWSIVASLIWMAVSL